LSRRNGAQADAEPLWLVDATTYRQELDPAVRRCKERYFRLEHLSKQRRYGEHVARGVRTYSPGLLRVASILAASGHRVRFLTLEEAEAELEEPEPGAERPAVVGFGSVCPTVPACARVAMLARRRLPGVRTVLGGSHAVVAPTLTSKAFEGAFDEVVDGFEADAAARLVGGAPGGLRLPAERLDYGLLPRPLQEYGLNVTTTTGCPFACSYCQDRLAPREVASLDGGLGRILDRLERGTPVHVCDSVLGGGVLRALEVCRALAGLDHGMLLSCDLRPELARPWLLDALGTAGFREVRIGLDSADEGVLASAGRRATPARLAEALESIRERSDLYVSVYLVTGLPGSTTATLERNVAVVEQLADRGLADQVRHHLYVPYPTDRCPSGDPRVRLRTGDWSRYDRNSHPVFDLDDLPAEALWDGFRMTEEAIVSTWARRLGLGVEELDGVPSYPDYHAVTYGLDTTVAGPVPPDC
jgi:radical SAM superfamily enzyme YgiQ (UPF0313 family)